LGAGTPKLKPINFTLNFPKCDKMDLVDAWECERSRRIEGIQKNENLFVKKACVERGYVN
jgi:endonuclease I